MRTIFAPAKIGSPWAFDLNVYTVKIMTKADIVSRIADRTGMEKADVLAVVEGFMREVKGGMESGDNVYLRGFGSFVLKKRAQKTGRNISKNLVMRYGITL